jgi:hypothetical protein
VRLDAVVEARRMPSWIAFSAARFALERVENVVLSAIGFS